METKNLILKPTVFDDCSRFYEWENTPVVTDFFSMNDTVSYEEIVTDYIKALSDETKLYYSIYLKEKEELIGKAKLTRIDRRCDSMDITVLYIADPALRNKGLGYEALTFLLEDAFLRRNMERVTIDHLDGNNRASMLYRKAGFEYEGVARNIAKKNGKYINLNIMSMLRADYFKVHREE